MIGMDVRSWQVQLIAGTTRLNARCETNNLGRLATRLLMKILPVRPSHQADSFVDVRDWIVAKLTASHDSFVPRKTGWVGRRKANAVEYTCSFGDCRLQDFSKRHREPA